MKFYEFGKENSRTIMFLPGNMATHRQFKNIVPLLEDKYRAITVDFDGFDETRATTYTNAKEQSEKLAALIKEKLDGRIDLVVAESLGSAPAVYLTTDTSISIGGVILDGAQYLDYGIFNPIMMAWAPKFAYNMFRKIYKNNKLEFPPFLLKICGRTNEDIQNVFSILATDFSLETIRNTFHEGMVFYRYVAKIEPQTHIAMACWYGENEQNMKRAVKYLKHAYPEIEVHPFKGLGHGSSTDYPELFVSELESFIERKIT